MCVANMTFLCLPPSNRWLTTLYSEVRRWFWITYFHIIHTKKLVTLLIHDCCSMSGKCNRGLSVVDSYKLLKGADTLSEEELFLAGTLGWCIEWVIFCPQIFSGRMSVKQLSSSSKFSVVFQLQAFFLVLDDIMDDSHTRRGQPCWFRVSQVSRTEYQSRRLFLLSFTAEKFLIRFVK